MYFSNSQPAEGQTCLYTSEQWPIACPHTLGACNPNGLVRTYARRHNLQNHSYRPIWMCWWGRFCWSWMFRKCHQQLRSKLGLHWPFSSFLKTINMNPLTTEFYTIKGDVTRNDLQRRFLAQHSVAMLEQCCNHSKQCRNNVATLCCAKNRRCKSSRITLP